MTARIKELEEQLANNSDNADTPLTINVAGQKFTLTDIQVDAAGRLNPHYSKV